VEDGDGIKECYHSSSNGDNKVQRLFWWRR